jgi:DNA-binding transcriptional regulator YiaG
MINIKTVKTEEKLKEIFNFLAKTFYDEAIAYNEHYFTMSERYTEMKEQYNQCKEMILYIEEDKKIVGALTSKKMKINKKIYSLRKQYNLSQEELADKLNVSRQTISKVSN